MLYCVSFVSTISYLDVILFQTVCFLKHITFYKLTIVKNWDNLDVIKE